jgi:phosphoribosylformylglycinamidine synthase PurS subunit
MEKLYEGKAKILYPEGENLRVYFKDEATAFNAQKRGLIPGKGVVNNKVSAFLFRYLEGHGIKTHFLKELSDREMLVRRVEILPLEVILRYRAAGSFAKRYGIGEGTPFKTPLVEFSLKNDALGDPLICENAILALGLAEEKELSEIQATTLKGGGAPPGLLRREGTGPLGLQAGVRAPRGRDPSGRRDQPRHHAAKGREGRAHGQGPLPQGPGRRGGGLPGGPKARFGGVNMRRYQATLLIELKEGILDPQGRAVEGVLRDLGHPVESVRVGKVLEVVFQEENLLKAEEKAKVLGQTLANPVMETWTLEALKEVP